ncbi:gastrula zinc finger protein XlCGF28.1-like [Silurus asotus]|uniref:Gastrula zinc finger protein XlCGF28.1-like n=1 Tax=Silurus asotus TaxID=30991 RepID=A0AAD5FFR5_SILAS|nr:gastrula zinc finger protein XlCGF28.1-like [Silurus asotus]
MAPSLENKLDDLRARVKFQRDIRDCNLLCFTETWLNPAVPDHAIQPAEFFSVYRMDRTLESGKSRGGGVCLMVNKHWCDSASIVPLSCSCTPNLERLTIKCRPFYLPREFSSVIVSAVYIPPQADTDTAVWDLHETLTLHQTQHWEAVLIVVGDFNSANLKRALPNFYQHITFPTRGERTLDHCYTTFKNSYKAQLRPPFGKSDHAAIFLMPVYKQRLKQEAPVQSKVARWTDQSVAALQDALDDADWDMYRRSSDDVNVFTEAVVGFIKKLTDDTVQKNTFRTFPNQKPWFDKTIRDALRSRSTAYNTGLATGDMDEYKAASYSVRRAAAANHASGASGTTSMHAERAREVNTFTISEHDVRRAFKRVNTRKAAGPDGITGRVLKACADQLAPVFTEIFNVSLEQSVVPSCFKQSTIVPVPKKPQLNDYRPVALTSVVMKCFKRLVIDFITASLPDTLDPLHWRSWDTVVVGLISNNDEMAYLQEVKNLQRWCQENNLLLNVSKTKELIVDFSTKQERSYQPLNICGTPVERVDSFRYLGVHITKDLSWSCHINTLVKKARQRLYHLRRLRDFKLPSQVLKTFYTCTIESVLTGSITSWFGNSTMQDRRALQRVVRSAKRTIHTELPDLQDIYSTSRKEIQHLATWCNNNNLLLNTSKTKKLIVDFRKETRGTQDTTHINGMAVERVSSFWGSWGSTSRWTCPGLQTPPAPLFPEDTKEKSALLGYPGELLPLRNRKHPDQLCHGIGAALLQSVRHCSGW